MVKKIFRASTTLLNFRCKAQPALSDSEVFNHSSSYQHIKGIKSNFFETPCHFDFYQSGTVKTEENKSYRTKEPN
jgi:hypothetical protein